MKFYLAPMEGITGYIYRQAYNSCFKPMDRYFTFQHKREEGCDAGA